LRRYSPIRDPTPALHPTAMNRYTALVLEGPGGANNVQRLSKLFRHLKRSRFGAHKLDLAKTLALLNARSQPNINELTVATRNLEILALNVKAMGYRLARELGKDLVLPTHSEARAIGLRSKLSTQADIESDWFAHWCRELGLAPFYHRKLWEFAYLLQAVHDTGNLRAGTRGLGFGCGIEPMASYFAAHGIDVMMTDLPPEDSRSKDWAVNNEHAATIDHAHHAHLVDRETFLRHVSHRNVDMNAIPEDLTGYDFCWSDVHSNISVRSRRGWRSSRTR